MKIVNPFKSTKPLFCLQEVRSETLKKKRTKRCFVCMHLFTPFEFQIFKRTGQQICKTTRSHKFAKEILAPSKQQILFKDCFLPVSSINHETICKATRCNKFTKEIYKENTARKFKKYLCSCVNHVLQFLLSNCAFHTPLILLLLAV